MNFSDVYNRWTEAIVCIFIFAFALGNGRMKFFFSNLFLDIPRRNESKKPVYSFFCTNGSFFELSISDKLFIFSIDLFMHFENALRWQIQWLVLVCFATGKKDFCDTIDTIVRTRNHLHFITRDWIFRQ